MRDRIRENEREVRTKEDEVGREGESEKGSEGERWR